MPLSPVEEDADKPTHAIRRSRAAAWNKAGPFTVDVVDGVARELGLEFVVALLVALLWHLLVGPGTTKALHCWCWSSRRQAAVATKNQTAIPVGFVQDALILIPLCTSRSRKNAVRLDQSIACLLFGMWKLLQIHFHQLTYRY